MASTFETLTSEFITTRARVVGSAIRLPNIFDRRGFSGARPGTLRANTTDDSQLLAFTTSLAEWRGFAANQAAEGLALGLAEEPLPVNIWLDTQMAIHAETRNSGSWGRAATVAAGIDYLFSDNLLAGVMVQGDWLDDTSDDGIVSGTGVLVGPYVSIALAENVSFDATVLYGGSSNTASSTVFGEDFSGDFETTRLYAKASLTGEFNVDALIVRPNATFFLASERAGDYTVANASGDVVAIAGTDLLQYRLTVGSKFEYAIELDNGAVLTPLLGLNVGFTGSDITGQENTQAFLGELTLGFEYRSEAGFKIGAEARGEMASDGFSSVGLRATISGQF